jgi:hypothetical protein
MELNLKEIAVAASEIEVATKDMSELSELQLAFVGGGIGDTIL